MRKCLTFDTHSPHKHTCPRERRKILTSCTALEPSKFRSEWLLPGPESATSTPGNKYCEMGNGGGLPNKRWGTGKTYRELKIMETGMSRDGKYGCQGFCGWGVKGARDPRRQVEGELAP